MGLKPDHWIRRMALEQGMIEPFIDRQVRQGVISYGVSSYGYDLRVADEFKIFTNVFGAVVDPKNFDPKSMVDFKGEVCVIPPNSFALARSVEYFRIPRGVLTVCLGKCLSAETRVVDAETGAYLPIAKAAQVRRTFGLDGWEMRELPVSNFTSNGIKPVYRLSTHSGLQIEATANHPFRQPDGWTALENLQPGDRIAVVGALPIFGKQPLFDWEPALLGLMIAGGQCETPDDSPVFMTNDVILVQLLKTCVHAGFQAEVIHTGYTSYHLVNRAARNAKMTGSLNRVAQWLEGYGLNVKAAYKFVPQAIFTAPKEQVAQFLRALFSANSSIHVSESATFIGYYCNSRRLIEDVHHLLLRFGIVSLIRTEQTAVNTTAYHIQITDIEEIVKFATQIGFWDGSINQIRLEEELLPFLEQHPQHKVPDLRKLGLLHTSFKQSLPYTTAAQVAQQTDSTFLAEITNGTLWDTVIAIEYIGEKEVFDLTVPGAHNFVANDLIVHNSTYARCGIIVNVTPFEPQWEGFVTLEISNTTPLPAKIYADEGLAQVLFFEADEECEVSYADKKGKYQHQQSIVLPKL